MTCVRGIVADFRGNPGGHLSDAASFAEPWLPNNTQIMLLYRSILDLVDGTAAVTWETDGEKERDWDIPLAVMTDQATASTAESAVALAKTHGSAFSVGQPTQGDAKAYVAAGVGSASESVQIPLFIHVTGFGFYQDRGIQPDRLVSFLDLNSLSLHKYSTASEKDEIPATFEEECLRTAVLCLEDVLAKTEIDPRREEH